MGEHIRVVRRVVLTAALAVAGGAVLAPAAWAGAGDLDPQFGAGNVIRGQVTTAISKDKDAIYAMALQPGNKVVAVGDSGTQVALARYLPDGSLDTSFGAAGDGKVLSAVGAEGEGRAVALAPDGKIVVAGYNVDPWSGHNLALLSFTPDGQIDHGFGYQGEVVEQIKGSKASDAYAVAVQRDGRIVAVGSSGNSVAVARYTADGRTDHSFGTGGSVTTNLGIATQGSAVALQKDGKIVVAGTLTRAKRTDIVVLRYSADGKPDQGFGAHGSVVTELGAQGGAARAVTLAPDGRIVVAGKAGDDIAVARYTADGKPDSTFGDAGHVVTLVGDSADGRAVALQQDGKVVVTGWTHSKDTGDSVAVVRYGTDGTPDAGFGTRGVAISDYGTPSDRGHAVVIQTDGKIVVGGRSHNPTAGDNFALTRFLGK